MHINFFGSNIEYGILLPVYVLKVNFYEDTEIKDTIDELAFLIIQLLKKDEKVDEKIICRKIGIPIKYEKLILHEINELKDKNIIKVNKDGILIEDIKFKKRENKVFYTFYDRFSKQLMEVLIPQNHFERMYGRIRNFNEKNFYKLKVNNSFLEAYDISKKIKEFTFKFNKILEFYYDDLQINLKEKELYDNNEIKEFVEIGLIPKNKLIFNYIEDADSRVEAELVIKARIDENAEVAYEWPFTFDRKSLYMDKFIWNYLDKNRLKNILNIESFTILEKCINESKDLNKKYELLDKNIERREFFNQAVYFYNVLKSDENLYRSLHTPISSYEKIIKSILNEYISKLDVSIRDEKNITLKKLMSYDKEKVENLKKYTIFTSIYNVNIKNIRAGFNLNRDILITSISDCMQIIYLAPFLLKDELANKLFDLFSTDHRIINFVNNIWLYRNNTQHNIEKGRFYNPEFDMEKKYKDRQIEEYGVLIEDLFYFLKMINEL